MINLLSAFDFKNSMFWILVILGIFLIVEIAVFAILLIYHKHKTPSEKPRQLVSISLDTSVVRREYVVGEKFDPSGLIVSAHFSDEPYESTLQDFTIVTPELITKLARDGKTPEDLLGCRIYLPDLSVEGKPTVTVGFQDKVAAFAITVSKPEEEVVEAPAPQVVVAAEPVEEVLEFTVTVVAPEELGGLQVALFNGNEQVGQAVNVENGKAILTAPAGEYLIRVYGLPDDDFEVTAEQLSAAKRAATVVIDYCEDYYDLIEEPEEEEEEAPAVEEVVDIPVPEPELVEYSIVVNAPEGITALQVALFNGDTQVGDAANVESGGATIFAEEGDYAVRIFGVPEGYIVTEGTVSASRHICTLSIIEPIQEEEELAVAEEEPAEPAARETQVIVEEPEVIVIPADPLIIEEESFEGGVLRYDRSFTARFIQADNETKQWYTDLKNYLLSFKKVKDRMSWKRESYRYGREPVVRLGFRGKTLCAYFPLDPNDYLESKYKVEDVSDNITYADTPCMYRLKNSRRVKYAMELIQVVVERLGGGKRIERESVDYYMPYEGLVELINKGLIKRNIKAKKGDVFFIANKTEDL